MINSKFHICKWHQCDIGYRYHHTGQEWDTHQQYAKTDIPKIVEKEYSEQNTPPQKMGALPQGYSSTPCIPGKHDDKWRAVALGTTIAVWALIILSVWRVGN